MIIFGYIELYTKVEPRKIRGRKKSPNALLPYKLFYSMLPPPAPKYTVYTCREKSA